MTFQPPPFQPPTAPPGYYFPAPVYAYAPPPLPPNRTVPPERTPWGVRVAWGVIVLIVAFAAAGPYLAAYRAKARGVPFYADPAGTQVTTQARYALGVKQMEMGREADGGQFIKQIDAAARTPRDRVRAAIIAAELAGTSAALERLTAVETAHGPASEVAKDAAALRVVYAAGPGALDDGARARLVERHDWFGRLALSWGKSADDPGRAAVLAVAGRTTGALLGVSGAAVLALIAGIVLLVIAIVKLAGGKLRLAFRPPATYDGVYLEAFAVYLVAFTGLSLLAPWLVRGGGGGLGLSAGLVVLAFLAGLVWPVVRGRPWGRIRAALGLHAGRGLLREVGAGLTGYLASFPLLALMMLLAAFLGRYFETYPHPIAGELGGGWWNVMLVYVLAAVIAPVTEETLFRGALFGHLRQRRGWVLAALITAGIFAAVHPYGVLGLPIITGLGVSFAAAREWRGSLVGPMTAHGVHNALMTTMMLLLMG